MNEPVKFEISLNPFTNQLLKEISGHVVALRIVLRALKDETYKDIGDYVVEDKFLVHGIKPLPEANFLKEQELNKCFKSMVTSLQDYIDRLIAVLNFIKKEKEISVEVLKTQSEFDTYIGKKIAEYVREVAEDKTLTVKKKLEILNIDKDIYDVLYNYFGLRNTLEHHKGVSSTERELIFKRFGVFTTSDKELLVPGPLEAGEGISIKIIDEKIIIPANMPVIVQYNQIQNMMMTIHTFVVPNLAEKMSSLISNQITISKTKSA